MYYINAENMLKAMSKPELVQLTNDEPRATEPDMAVVDAAIVYQHCPPFPALAPHQSGGFSEDVGDCLQRDSENVGSHPRRQNPYRR